MNKSVLVGDIGSTKSSWYFSGEPHRLISLPGFNPLTHTAETGRQMIEKLLAELKSFEPESIWYYGTGVVGSSPTDLVKNQLHISFPHSTVHVFSDLLGAARAACGNNDGTVAILGTGSHAAVFDGNQIIRQANALGYILGDEGGGCDIGKALSTAYFYEQMPDPVRMEMKKVMPGNRADFVRQLYTSPSPNQYLAHFAKVAVELQHHPWIEHLVSQRFNLFVKHHLLPLHPSGPIHVLGSIGCIFAGLLEKEFLANNLEAGQFIKDPAFRLFERHMNNDFDEK